MNYILQLINKLKEQTVLFLELKYKNITEKMLQITEILVGEDEIEDIGEEGIEYQINCIGDYSMFLDKELNLLFIESDGFLTRMFLPYSIVIWEKVDDNTIKVVRSV